MNARLMASLRIGAAAAVVAGGAVFATVREARADDIVRSSANEYTVSVPAPSPIATHVGPGIGSSKSPYFPSRAEVIEARSRGEMLFHATEQPTRTLTYHMGPGTGSVKAPPFNNPF